MKEKLSKTKYNRMLYQNITAELQKFPAYMRIEAICKLNPYTVMKE